MRERLRIVRVTLPDHHEAPLTDNTNQSEQ